MPPKILIGQNKQQSLGSDNICRIHKQLFTMICLHSSCHGCYKLICPKCKKQKHYQHPNRVINLNDFYEMLLNNKMDFIQNSLGFALINIKNKLVYVSNFRVYILQKQSMLMQSARMIHSLIQRMLQQKCELVGHLSHINQETQQQGTDKLLYSLQQMRKYIGYNPLQKVIRINSEKVGMLRVQLQKQCQSTKNIINSIRQYLVKIVQVMIQQQIQQEDIQYQQFQDLDEKAFNINIKRPNHVQLNEKQPKYKVEFLLGMFESLLRQEVERNEGHIESDVQKLEQEIKFKQQIVMNIRQRSISKDARSHPPNDQLKHLNSPTRRNSPQETQHNQHKQRLPMSQIFKKVYVPTAKAKNTKVDSKNLAKYTTSKDRSPKSPKVRSIADNFSQESPPANFNKVSAFNVISKRSPKINVKNSTGEKPENQIKGKTTSEYKPQLINKTEYQNLHQQAKIQQSQQLTNSATCQLIQQREQEKRLNTETNLDERQVKVKLSEQNEQSLLLQANTIKSQQKQIIQQLNERLFKLQKENNKLIEDLDDKVEQIHKLEVILRGIQGSQGKHQGKHSNQHQNQHLNQYQRKSIKKEFEVGNQQNLVMSNKKFVDQRKSFQTEIQKIQKQLKQKQSLYTKQHQINLQNAKLIKQMEDTKRNSQQLSRTNDCIAKKNEQLTRDVQELKQNLIEQKNNLEKRLMAKISELQNQKQQLNSASKQLISKNKQIQTLLNESQGQVYTLTLSLRQVQQNLSKDINSQIQPQLQSQRLRTEQVQAQNKQFLGKIRQSLDMIRQLQKSISYLEQTIKQKDNKIKISEHITKDMQIRITEQQEMIEKLKEQLSIKVITIKQPIRGKYQTSYDFQSQREQNIKQLRHKQRQLLRMQQTIFQKQKLISNLDGLKSALQKQIACVVIANASQIGELKQQLQAGLLALQQKQYRLAETSLQIKQKLLHIKNIQFQLGHKQTLLSQKQLQITQQLQKQKEFLSEIQKLQSINRSLKERCELNEKTMKELEYVVQERQSEKIWFKDQEIYKLQSKVKQIVSELLNCKKQIVTLNQDLRIKEQGISVFQSQKQRIQSQFTNLVQQNSSLLTKLQKTQQELQKTQLNSKKTQQNLKKTQQDLKKTQQQLIKQKLKLKLKQHQKQDQKHKKQSLKQYQQIKKINDDQKQRNDQNKSFDIKNYIPLIKYKELKEWYEIAMKRIKEMKEQIIVIKEEKKSMSAQYQAKLKVISEENTSLSQRAKSAINQSFNLPLQQGQTLVITEPNNQHLSQLSPKQQAQDPSTLQNKYTQIQSIIQLITGDMHLLQQKVKQNTIIQKVYLKELDRKRIQNRKLRQQIQEYRQRQRNVGGVSTDRYYEKAPSSSSKVMTHQKKYNYKVYYASGFQGSQSRLSSAGHTNDNVDTQGSTKTMNSMTENNGRV